jgi:hypothetical protein
MNPETPHIHGTIKLHKEDKPVRPTVNWKNSPGYKIATLVAKLLKDTTHLPYTYNILNSENLINNLKEIKVQSDTKLCLFDIKNMYTNILQQELLNIIRETMENNYIHREHINETMSLVKIILNQNYFQHNQIFKQQDGLAMGAPTSAILSEIFMQHLEHNSIQEVLQKHNIVDYYRYVDDILIVYNEKHTNINDTLTSIKYTPISNIL